MFDGRFRTYQGTWCHVGVLYSWAKTPPDTLGAEPEWIPILYRAQASLLTLRLRPAAIGSPQSAGKSLQIKWEFLLDISPAHWMG